MQDVVQFAGDVDVFTDVVVVELELRQGHQVLDVLHVARNQVVHPDDVVPFLDEPVAEVRP